MNWINVTDRKPATKEEADALIIWYDGEWLEAEYWISQDLWVASGGVISYKPELVTHWMIPTKPE